MLSSTILRVSRTSMMRMAPREITGLNFGGVRSMSIDTELRAKEKVEEDRFIRQMETDRLEAKRREEEKVMAAKALEKEIEAVQKHEAELNATMDALADLLKKSGDKISKQGLENLINWKRE